MVDGLRKSLRQFRQHWDVETSTSGADALARLSAGPFDALVSDAQMPEMDGEHLLAAARDRWPQMLRVVLSGEVGKQGAARLTGLAHHFIPKPVAVPVLHARIEEALAARERLSSPGLQALVCRFGALPALPGTFAAVEALLSRDASLEAFVQVVERDPAVCANVLRAVNSAWFGLRTRVSSVREAVRLLGLRPLRDLVLAAEVFSGSCPAVEALRRAALERLGALPALLKLLGAEAHREAAATALILADVGQLLVLLRAPVEAAVIERDTAGGHERVEVEQRLLGADHTVLGAVLMSMWCLPAELVEAVALHHAPRSVPPVGSLSSVLALCCAVQDYLGAVGLRRERLAEHARALAAPFGVNELDGLIGAFATSTQEEAA